MGSDPFQLAKQNVGGRGWGRMEEEEAKMLHRGGGKIPVTR